MQPDEVVFGVTVLERLNSTRHAAICVTYRLTRAAVGGMGETNCFRDKLFSVELYPRFF